jgi:hypothetical protein
MIIKFTDHKYAQAHMEPINGGLALYSYTTCVATLQEGWLHINGLYSMTTRRHIGWFMRELGPFTYQLAKQLYEDNKEFNIWTGEVRDID